MLLGLLVFWRRLTLASNFGFFDLGYLCGCATILISSFTYDFLVSKFKKSNHKLFSKQYLRGYRQ